MSISSVALSGIHAAQFRMTAAAHNVANAQMPGFRRQVVVQEAQPGGGVSASVSRAGQPGPALAGDIVEHLAASYAFKANVLTLRTERETLGSLLDLHV